MKTAGFARLAQHTGPTRVAWLLALGLALIGRGAQGQAAQVAPSGPSAVPAETRPQPSASGRTIYLVRHAEKVDESPQALLSAIGHARAQRLADTLSRAGVQRIVVSEFRRTQQTAQPLADRLGIKPAVLPANDHAALQALLWSASDPVGSILVVGHSDTLPRILRDLGAPSEPIAGGDYGNLFVVVLPPRGSEAATQARQQQAPPPTLIRLRY